MGASFMKWMGSVSFRTAWTFVVLMLSQNTQALEVTTDAQCSSDVSANFNEPLSFTNVSGIRCSATNALSLSAGGSLENAEVILEAPSVSIQPAFSVKGSQLRVRQGSLLGKGEDETVDVTLTVQTSRPLGGSSLQAAEAAAHSAATGTVIPRIYEFQATTPSGYALNGVLYGVSQGLYAGFNNGLIDGKALAVRATIKKIKGKYVLFGNAIPDFGATPTPEQDDFSKIAWTVVAVKEGVMLEGPPVGRIFHYQGDAKVKAACGSQLVGSLFDVTGAGKATWVTGVLVGLATRRVACDDLDFSGKLNLSMDARVVSTHIGPLLRSQGFLAANGNYARSVESFGLAVVGSLRAEGDTGEGRIRDGVRVVDAIAAEEFLGFNRDLKAIVFRNLNGSLEGLAIGEYIVSRPRPGMPNGFLFKVVDMRTINGLSVLRAEPGRIRDVIDDVNIQIRRSYNASDVAEADAWYGFDPSRRNSAGVLIAQNSASENGKRVGELIGFGDTIPVSVNKVIYDKDGDETTRDDQVYVEGSLDFTPDVAIKLVCTGTLCGQPDFKASFILEESSRIKLTGNIKLLDYYRQIELPPKITLPPIVIMIGPVPIVFVPEFGIYLNVEGDLSLSLDYEATQDLSFEAGIEHVPNQGWGVIDDFSSTSSSQPPNYAGELSAKAEVFVRGEFMLYGVAGVYGDIGAFAKFVAGYPRNPIWELKGGLNVDVGVAFDYLFDTLEYEETVLKKRWQIDSAPNQPPEAATVSQPYPKVLGYVEKNGDVQIDVSSFDPEQGKDCCVVTLETDLPAILRPSKINTADLGVVEAEFQEAGMYTLSATTIDAQGLTFRHEIEVEVLDRLMALTGTPQSTFVVPSSPINGQFSTFKLTLTDTANLGADLDCCQVDWYVNDELVATTTGDNGDSMTHSLAHRWQISPVRINSGLKEKVTAEATFNIIHDGKPDGVIKRTQYVEVQNKPKISNTLTDLNMSFPDSPIGRGPAELGDRVTYEVTLNNPGVCSQIKWYSSNTDDGVAQAVDGLVFMGFGVLQGDKSIYTQRFSTPGTRVITAQITDNECEKPAMSITTRISDPFGGGTAPGGAGGGYQFTP